jgi:hypothetical protein
LTLWSQVSVKDYFSTEALGVKVTKKLCSKEEERASELMSRYTRRVDDRWETCLLWRTEVVVLPNNKPLALRRLAQLEKQMDADPVLAKAYVEKMDDMVRKGYAAPVSQRSKVTVGRLWYLPHFCVRNPQKPGKIRSVFDAASKFKGVSLNDCLLKGSDLLCDLVGVLFKFRQYAVAIGADIREMFLQVRMREEDRSAQRYIWRGMDRDKEPQEYEMLVMTFGSACSPYCAQLVKNLNAEEVRSSYPEAYEAITKRHYVDDYLDSVPTLEAAQKLVQEVTRVHRQGGFEIVGWNSNSDTLLKTLPEAVRAVADKDLEMTADGGQQKRLDRTLGVQWSRAEDTLTFKCSFHKVEKDVLAGRKCPTKRDVLKIVMSLYDLLGLLGPFNVQAKIILQDIWRSAVGWDDEIPDSIRVKFQSWLDLLPQIEQVRVPRCYHPDIPQAVDVQLHLFVDASEKAFSAVAYFRVVLPDGSVKVSFIMSKTRVSPLKPLSIPRLELQAALVGVRMAKFVLDNHDYQVNKTYFWSDSRTVLCWLRSDARRYKQFVASRVGEILEDSDVASWNWVPTSLNVADEATRDVAAPDLRSESRWFNGPLFLRLSPADWPKEGKNLDIISISFL